MNFEEINLVTKEVKPLNGCGHQKSSIRNLYNLLTGKQIPEEDKLEVLKYACLKEGSPFFDVAEVAKELPFQEDSNANRHYISSIIQILQKEGYIEHGGCAAPSLYGEKNRIANYYQDHQGQLL